MWWKKNILNHHILFAFYFIEKQKRSYGVCVRVRSRGHTGGEGLTRKNVVRDAYRRNTRYKNPQHVARHEQICCVTNCEFDEKWATKPKFVAQSRPTLFVSQKISPTCNKKRCCPTSWSRKVKNTKRRPKTCNKTMLRDKLKVFVSGISPPLGV